MDIFERIKKNRGPLGRFSAVDNEYMTFHRLEGELSSRMKFKGKEKIVWSINNYLGLANHPAIREADAQAAKDWGLAYPMGARIMSGNTANHLMLEQKLADHVGKQKGFLLNFGYQGCMSVIDALVTRHDVIVYDAEAHACIMDGVRLHTGKRFVYQHNDIESCEKMLKRACALAEKQGGGVLVITEGVFGMAGDQGKLKEIADLKSKYSFRLMVDDAHGYGQMGKTGAGTCEEQGCTDAVDVYFSTFAKSMACIGAFIAADEDVIDFLKYNTRSQIYAKSLPMPLVVGLLKRLEMLTTMPELREKLWYNTHKLQKGLRDAGLDIGKTNTCVTPVYLSGLSIQESGNIIIDVRENYNIFCSPVMYPVIPKGQLMLRLIPTAVHTDEDIDLTLKAFSEVKQKIEQGFYSQIKLIDVSSDQFASY
jgi:glycine C-acetyltransferase